MNNIRTTLAIVWRIAIPYFKSEDKWAGRGLLATVIAIELALVGTSVVINQWRARFYNALQEKDWEGFVREMIVFSALAAIAVVLSICQLYFNQWLQIRWRRWMTNRYLGSWLHDANHYRMQLQGEAVDNPDQRVSDDVKNFVSQTLGISTGLLSSIVTLASFVVILWGLSAAAPLHLFGSEFSIPGYLVWGALIYALLGTALTQWIGAPLVNLNFQQERLEADFRFNLVRVRENGEQIALLKGDDAERGRLSQRFGSIVGNWYAIMGRTMRLTAVTGTYGQASVVFPFILAAPAYFAGKIQLGVLMQTSEAFGQVQDALSFFVTSYRTLADWRAVVARLDGFEMSMASAERLAISPDAIVTTAVSDAIGSQVLSPDRTTLTTSTDMYLRPSQSSFVPGKMSIGQADAIGQSRSASGAIGLQELLLKLPDGTPLMTATDIRLRPGESTLLTGPSGAGKSTLFRAIAGIWPFGKGTISIPANTTLMTLPQRPYFPIGSLHAAIVYPAPAASFSDDRIREVLAEVGLPKLATRLTEEAHWSTMLSLGEQQRLGVARALLHAPHFLFLDEATASLDEPSEAALYHLLADELPGTTVISIGHRSTLNALHERNIRLVRDGDQFALKDAAPTADAS